MDETVKELLSNVRVASPCAANWDDMSGTESVRSCERCQHKVYNLSEMTAPEAADLLRKAEGRLCVRFYRRSDGTVMTRDCPVGAQVVRTQKRRRFGLIGLSMASVAGLVGANLHEKSDVTTPASSVIATPEDADKDKHDAADFDRNLRQHVEKYPQWTTGVMNTVTAATPSPTKTSEPQFVMGEATPQHESTPVKLGIPSEPEPQAVMGAPMIAPSSSSFEDKPFLRDTPAEQTPPRDDPFQKPDGIR